MWGTARQQMDPRRARPRRYCGLVRHTFVWVRVHLVWSTFRRQPWIDATWQQRLYRCLVDTARRKGALVLGVGGARDHVHLYVSLSATMSVAQLVDALKANSSRWVHDAFPQYALFSWQKGYSALAVCKRCEARVIFYISNQEARHGLMHGPIRQGGEKGS